MYPMKHHFPCETPTSHEISVPCETPVLFPHVATQTTQHHLTHTASPVDRYALRRSPFFYAYAFLELDGPRN